MKSFNAIIVGVGVTLLLTSGYNLIANTNRFKVVVSEYEKLEYSSSDLKFAKVPVKKSKVFVVDSRTGKVVSNIHAEY